MLTTVGLNSSVLMTPCSPAPSTIAGRKAISTAITKRRAPGSSFSPVATCHSLWK